MNNAHKSLIGLLALGSALAMPIAFAQSDTTSSATQDPTTQSTTTAQDPTTEGMATQDPTATSQDTTTTTEGMAAQDSMAQDSMQSAPPADQATTAPGSAPKQVTWADLDIDKDGNLSKAEASPLESLSQVFDQADGDGNGMLTADEYKAYVAKNGSGAGGSEG